MWSNVHAAAGPDPIGMRGLALPDPRDPLERRVRVVGIQIQDRLEQHERHAVESNRVVAEPAPRQLRVLSAAEAGTSRPARGRCRSSSLRWRLSRLPISAAQSVTTCPSTHDTMSSLVSFVSGPTSPGVPFAAAVVVAVASSVGGPATASIHEQGEQDNAEQRFESCWSASQHDLDVAGRRERPEHPRGAGVRKSERETSWHRGSDRRAAVVRTVVRRGRPTRRRRVQAATDPEVRAPRSSISTMMTGETC